MHRGRCDGKRPRCGDRNLRSSQLGGEPVLFEDLRIAPSARPIELRDDDPAVFQKDLEDAVLVRVELDQPAVTAQADAVERVEHASSVSGRHRASKRMRSGPRRQASPHPTRRWTAQRRGGARDRGLSTTTPPTSSGSRFGRSVRSLVDMSLSEGVAPRGGVVDSLEAAKLAAAEAFEAVVGGEEGVLEQRRVVPERRCARPARWRRCWSASRSQRAGRTAVPAPAAGPRAGALLLGTRSCSSATVGRWSTGQRR